MIGEAPSPDERPVPDYWSWYHKIDPDLILRLENTELLQAWESIGLLHDQFVVAVNETFDAVAAGNETAARRKLDTVFQYSSSLTSTLVGASIAELFSEIKSYENALATRYERDFLEAVHMGSFTVRIEDSVLLDADDSFLGFFGYGRDELVGESILGVLDKSMLTKIQKAANQPGNTERTAVKGKNRDGKRVALDVIAYRERHDAGEVLRGFAVNVTQAESEAQQRKLFSTAIETSQQVVVITNAKQEIIYANPAFTRVTGYELNEVLGKTPRILQGPETSQATRMALREAIAAGNPVHVEILNYGKNGRPYWQDLSIVPVRDDTGEVVNYVSIQSDITSRKLAEQEMTRLAMEDHLTGLPNRRVAEDRLETEWNRARRDSVKFAVAIVDIDRFKLVNDQYGHHIGDQVLKHVADLMAGNLRGGDWVARWGGEEFILCFHDLERRGAMTAGERLRKLIKSKVLNLPAGELSVTVSMGVSLFSKEHTDIDAMLAQADALLYEAKHSGRDKVLCGGKDASHEGGVIWEGSQVQSALQEDRILPAYQPIVNLRTGKIVAEEALARIRAKDDSLIPAANFIQAAEALHLVAAIDQSVSASAIDHFARIIKEQGTAIEHAHFINLSPQFLANGEQVEQLLHRVQMFWERMGIKDGGLNPLVIEITERQAGDILLLKKHLKPLMDQGLQLALDDFGSGYSSFLYLAELPVNYLKIEGWMVQRINKDSRTRQLVETIVNTAQKFKVITVAECVEDAQTAQVLCDIGVDWAQGYYFAKPLVETA